jgi:hypothetical protein
MEDLLTLTGILPSLEAGLCHTLDQLAVSGDGSVLESASSPHGTPSCDCSQDDRQAKRCTHPRTYTSGTAQWCFSTGRNRYVFGDRYYHLTLHGDGHDLPLLTIMGEGSEADHTLSLKAMDDALKLTRDGLSGLTLSIFIGDKHHDTYAHAEYYATKGLKTVIPLRTDSSLPHLDSQPDLTLNEEGTPRCPGGGSLKHHHYDRRKHTHVYACPAKRLTHRDGKALYVFHAEDCPADADCCPESLLGPLAYLRPDDDQRRYPEIPRDSQRFQRLYNERTTTERLNALNDRYRLDRRSRSAAYGLIDLTLANILEHAVVRHLKQVTQAGSEQTLLQQTLAHIAQA